MKKLSFIFICIILCAALTACSLVIVNPLYDDANKSIENSMSGDSSGSVHVSIISGDEFSISSDFILPVKADSGEYFRQLCNRFDVVIKGVDEGYITEIGGIKTEGDYAWMFYINDELSEVGIADYIPTSDDKITLSYVNWKELYNL